MRRLLPLLALLACTPNFQSESEVSDLRVLAVMAEPPEAQFDKSSVDDVQVRVLAVDPAAGGRGGTATAVLCALTDSRRCGDPRLPLPPQQVGAMGDEIKFTVQLPPRLIELAQQSDALKGLGGIRAMLSLSVDDGDPHGVVWAAKTLIYSQRGKPPNHNPLMTGLRRTRDGQEPAVLQPLEMVRLQPGVKIGLRPLLAPGAEEEYDAVDLRGNTVHLKEQAVYSFFATIGAELDHDIAYEPLDGVAPPDGLVRIDAPSNGSGTLWIVVRDGRGGESWLSFPWTTR
jgi:hypothetical protein